MSLTVRNSLIEIAGIATVYFLPGRFIPDKIEIPPHYWTARNLGHALDPKEELADAIRASSWGGPWVSPLREGVAAVVDSINYRTNLYVIGAFWGAEKLIRWDFNSSVQMAEKNLASLKEHNVTYEQEIEKLTPVVELVLCIMEMASDSTEKLSLKNTLGKERVECRKRKIEEIMACHEKIDVDAALRAINKVSAWAQERLNNPRFLQKLEKTVPLLESTQKTFNEVTLRLEKAKDQLSSRITRLEALIAEYEKLDLQEEKLYADLQSKIRNLYKRLEKLQCPTQPMVSYEQQLISVAS